MAVAAHTVQELVAALVADDTAVVMELVEPVAAVTVVAAGLVGMHRADSNVYKVNTIQHLLAAENGVVLLGLERKVQDLSLPTRRSACGHKHDRPWR